MILLKNGLVLENDKLVKKDVYIENDMIVEKGNPDVVYDCEGTIIMPGLCDIHVHLREPGFTSKETIKTGTMSAAKGGVTTVFAMPNVIPYPDNLLGLSAQTDIIKRDAVVKVYPYATTTKGEKGQELSDMEVLAKHVLAFTDDGVGVNNLELLEEACNIAKKHNLVICSHAEDDVFKALPAGEYVAVKREIEIAKKTGVKYNFCHMSTKESFTYIQEAQKLGYDNITCEVAPHHLFLNETMINGNPNFKMNPPLRSEIDRQATLEALLNGTATIIASDHAPHTKQEKSREYHKCPNGIIGLETMAPLVYTNLIKTGLAPITKFYDWLINNPRKLMGLEEVKIAPGYKADIACMDINEIREYKEDEILSLGVNSPYIGMKLTGFMRYTFVDGKLVYKR